MFYAITLGLWFGGVNSAYATSVAALVCGIFLVYRLRVPLTHALLAGVTMALMMFVIYAAGFIMSENTESVLKEIWFLYDSPLGARIFGVPLTQLMWAFCFGFLVSIL